MNARKRILEIEDISQLIAQKHCLNNKALQGLDLSRFQINWEKIDVKDTLFLGCKFANVEDECIVKCRGAYVFPRFEGLPYNPYRAKLYTWQELMEGYNPYNDQSLDYQIYQHFMHQGRFNPNIREALAQRIHDHAIDDALRDFLEFNKAGMTKRKGVGFMGGHGMPRTDPAYRKVAQAARKLTREGYFVISGGGPGIMEAANFGAYMADTSEDEFEEALEILGNVPLFRQIGYIAQSYEVLKKHPTGCESLAVPTWFYGHEPTNLFATHIAKYFSNSIREDGLLAISLFGVIYAPGSAGTTQEIFMDATQNHYGSFGYYSPMIFFGKKRYQIDTLLYPLVRQLAWGRKYADMLFITDEPDEIVEFIKQHPPVKKM
jgi:predicted Rossmann-fold nucleotide-binding protein